MNYIEVKKELKKEFNGFLKPLGYNSKCDAQGCIFSIIKGNSQYYVGYSVANYIDEFTTGCFIQIGIIPIQKVIWHILENYKLTDNYGNTICSGISDYFNELNFNYRIKNIGDVKKWGVIVKNFYEEYVISFFEKFSSVEAIDKLFNDDTTKKIKYIDNLGWQIIIGLVAAKLNNNPKYNELRDYYKSEVESKFQGYFMYDKCMKVINFLDNYTSEELNKLAVSI